MDGGSSQNVPGVSVSVESPFIGNEAQAVQTTINDITDQPLIPPAVVESAHEEVTAPRKRKFTSEV